MISAICLFTRKWIQKDNVNKILHFNIPVLEVYGLLLMVRQWFFFFTETNSTG